MDEHWLVAAIRYGGQKAFDNRRIGRGPVEGQVNVLQARRQRRGAAGLDIGALLAGEA